MFTKYYQQELNNLKQTAEAFAEHQPALATMLGEPSSDPDVERLLEGVAFLSGYIREKIDDEYPEIIHNLLRQLWPHYLRPVPSVTLMAFSPYSKQAQTLNVNAGTTYTSRPVDGINLQFTTCFEVTVPPFRVTDVVYQSLPGASPEITVSLATEDVSAELLALDSLRLFMGNRFRDAAVLYQALMTTVKSVQLRYRNDQIFVFNPDALQPGGFGDNESLVPYPSNLFPGYRFIQEYFQFPEKFMFVDLSGWQDWTDRQGVHTFDIVFQLSKPLPHALQLNKKNLIPGVTPAVNIFSWSAEPLSLDHTKADYTLKPSDGSLSHYQVYSVDRVSGYSTSSAGEIVFRPFYKAAPLKNDPIYDERIKKSPVREGIDHYISVAYAQDGTLPDCNTISVEMSCTNGFLPEWLGKNDINNDTNKTKEEVRYTNISKPTMPSLPTLGSKALWHLLSLLSLNNVTLADSENLKTLLRLFLMENDRDKKRLRANEKKIDGIMAVSAQSEERIISGIPLRGMKVHVKAASDHFAGTGDLYLFGMVLSRFYSLYAAMNTFIRLEMTDTTTGETYSWPARLGNQLLI